MRFQANAVVRRVDIRIGDRSTVAIDDVDPVIIPEGLAVHIQAVQPKIGVEWWVGAAL